MEGDKNYGWTFDQAGYGAGAAGNTERIELFSGDRFDHAVKFFEIEPRMNPELRYIVLLK